MSVDLAVWKKQNRPQALGGMLQAFKPKCTGTGEAQDKHQKAAHSINEHWTIQGVLKLLKVLTLAETLASVIFYQGVKRALGSSDLEAWANNILEDLVSASCLIGEVGP